MDVVKCDEMSNTVDGTKSLREPLSASAKDRAPRGLIPHQSCKSRKRNFELSERFNPNAIDDVDVPDTDGRGHEELDEMSFGDNSSNNKSLLPEFSVGFISAQKYMNPTLTSLGDSLPQSDSAVSSQPIHSSVLVSKVGQKPNSKHVVTQKNSLDRYFKPVYTSNASTAESVSNTRSHAAGSTERVADCSLTPENSPRKSVLMSPIAKLPGSDTIYYSPQLSQKSSSRDSNSIMSSQGSSSVSKNMTKSHKSCTPASALFGRDDDLDFEASFDYTWMTNPVEKCKFPEQLGRPPKKKSAPEAVLSKMCGTSELSFDSAFVNSSTASTLQQQSAVPPNMSEENFGLFGFSNNTLLALDSDTDFEEDTIDYFSRLPPEVVSNILCRLPFTDLCLNVNRVCLSWKNIIESDNVSYITVPWPILGYCSMLLREW